MNWNSTFKKVLAVTLATTTVASFNVTAYAETNRSDDSFSFEQVDNSEVKVSAIVADPIKTPESSVEYKNSDKVRVSIFLKDDSVVDVGYPTDDILNNDAALKHMKNVKKNQKNIEKKIAKALGKKSLNVKQNLAIVSNIISAEVAYGDIHNIEDVDEVEKVILENEYKPAEIKEAAKPQMAIAANNMTGAKQAWEAGLTGAGSRIAVIDTGLDIDHQSFDEDAFEYALEQDAKAAGKNVSSYKNTTLNLLRDQELENAMTYLNAYEISDHVLTVEEVEVSSKIPYVFNYVDRDTNVRHIYDTQGEHGSHVAGICAANRYVKAETGYVDAISSVGVAGDAPDAQILVMKVFGQNGGAYDSDYMAAIEDAIILDCDSVNLSLGSNAAGMATPNESYQEVMEKMTKTDTVVVMSAGNSGAWAEETTHSALYSDGVNYATGGSPGSYENSFTVASVENVGQYGDVFSVADVDYPYTEALSFGNEPLVSLSRENEEPYDYVFLDNYGTEEDFEGIDVEGKIVFCRRGACSFFEKANSAAKRGAVATFIINNEPGAISMNLDGYEYSAPCVLILQEYGEAILASSEPSHDGKYYTGKIVIKNEKKVNMYEKDYYEMASTSSYGVPGDLTLKPEIAAPGGNIWSVNGTHHAGGGVDQYELMSGTSMAAPQISGMSAVMKAAFDKKLVKNAVDGKTNQNNGNNKKDNKNNKNKNKKNDSTDTAATFVQKEECDIESINVKKTGFTERAMVQSLLMSTAEPMKDAKGNYYPVFQQGAGLANVYSAMKADSYITMGADATSSYADGKVKVEFGDDPERKGSYDFTFTIHNLSKSNVTYDLNADIFTQNVEDDFLLYDTVAVDAYVNFSCGDKIMVKKNGSATVKASISFPKDVKAKLDAAHPAGTYVEGYVYAKANNGSSDHSIPVLGYYGSWTDPSMYDVGSYPEYLYGVESRAPYLKSAYGYEGNGYTISYGDGSGEYYFGTNNYSDDAEYHPEYASMNNENGDHIKRVKYGLIRNAGNVSVSVTDHKTRESYAYKELGKQEAPFYDSVARIWRNASKTAILNWDGEGLSDGTCVDVNVIAVPEYYCKEDGSYDVTQLSDGAYLGTTLTIDNTAPELVAVGDTDSGELKVSVKDNLAVAAIILYAQNGRTEVSRVAVDAPEYEGILADGLEDNIYLIQAIDYAGNKATYKVFMNTDLTDHVDSVELDKTSLVLFKNNRTQLKAVVNPYTVSDESVIWSSSDETVATVDENGYVKGLEEGTCTITAAATMDSEITATCEVEVKSIEKGLNAAVWNEDGQVWLSSLIMDDIPNYDKLVSWPAPIVSLTYDESGTLYAADIDEESGASYLYVVDPETHDLSEVGSDDIGYHDMAQAPDLKDCILAVFYNYVLVVNKTTGGVLYAWDFPSEVNLVGITYTGREYSEELGVYYDEYCLLDSAGNLYGQAFATVDEEFYNLIDYNDALLTNVGVECDTPYYQSLYSDEQYLYLSIYDEIKHSATLYVVDSDTLETYEIGNYGNGVGPITGLFQLDGVIADTTHMDLPDATAFIKAKEYIGVSR